MQVACRLVAQMSRILKSSEADGVCQFADICCGMNACVWAREETGFGGERWLGVCIDRNESLSRDEEVRTRSVTPGQPGRRGWG